MTDILRQTQDYIWKWLPVVTKQGKEVERVIVKEISTMWPQAGGLFVRLAGLSGAAAVVLGAYQAHAFKESDAPPGLKVAFETGNRYHMLHTLALLAVPLMRRPNLSGTLLTTGMVLFCGSCYYHALTGNTTIRKVTPYGGMLLIIGWLTVAL